MRPGKRLKRDFAEPFCDVRTQRRARVLAAEAGGYSISKKVVAAQRDEGRLGQWQQALPDDSAARRAAALHKGT